MCFARLREFENGARVFLFLLYPFQSVFARWQEFENGARVFLFYPFQSVFARWQEFENGASDTFFFLPECFPCCSAGPPNHSSTELVSYHLYKLAFASDLKISVWVSCIQSFSKATVLPRNNSKFLRLFIHVQFMQGARRLNIQRCVLSCLFMFK